ncbi:MAG: leucine-rich repeat protein [Prevotella sp.]|nr:leucine-rich repeat protein [Prevotella sp.]
MIYMTTQLFKNINHKGLILAMLLVISSSSLWADSVQYDFSAENTWTVQDKDTTATIYYIKLVDDNEDAITDSEGNPTVAVIYNGLPGDDDDDEEIVEDHTGYYSGDIVIPDTVTYNDTTYTVTGIYDDAFKQCYNLTSVTIHSTITSIGGKAFYHSTGLVSVLMAKDENGDSETCGVASIGEQTFEGCSALTTAEIFTSALTTIGIQAFQECKKLGYISDTESDLSLDLSGITGENLGDKAFLDCENITSVKLSDDLTKITQRDFEGCSNLASVTTDTNTSSIGLPSKLEIIEYQAFENCKKLEGTLDFSTTAITSIAQKAFHNCVLITSVNFPVNVSSNASTTYSIAYQLFQGCTGLESVTIYGESSTNSITSIDRMAFSGCTKLSSFPNIPSTVTKIDYQAFLNCSALTSITLNEGLTEIDYQAFTNSGITSVTIPKTVTTWGTTSSSEQGGNYAFSGCTSLEEVIFEDGLTSIGTYTFEGCTSLTEIKLPLSITTLGEGAFSGCSDLETVYLLGRTASGLESSGGDITPGTDCFSGVAENCFLVVPEDGARFYTAKDDEGNYVGYGATVPTADGWNTIAYLREDTVTIPITTAEGYVTRYSPYSYTLEEGLEGGVVSVDENGDLNIEWKYEGGNEEKNTVPGGSAILIKGAINQIDTSFANVTLNTNYATDTATVSESGSMMYGTVNPNYNSDNYGVTDVPDDDDYSAENYYFYKLSYLTNEYSDRVLGFYWQNSSGSAFPINGGDGYDYDTGLKLAWLAVEKDSGAKAIRSFYPLDVNTTGIQDIETAQPNYDVEDSDSDIIYNLQGMRVKEMTKKGIYIINGKKVLY